eukprot:5906045-Pleurochrysis_carterae.AAC.1
MHAGYLKTGLFVTSYRRRSAWKSHARVARIDAGALPDGRRRQKQPHTTALGEGEALSPRHGRRDSWLRRTKACPDEGDNGDVAGKLTRLPEICNRGFSMAFFRSEKNSSLYSKKRHNCLRISIDIWEISQQRLPHLKPNLGAPHLAYFSRLSCYLARDFVQGQICRTTSRQTSREVTCNRTKEQQNQMQPQRGHTTKELGNAAICVTHT